jgi:hypothetical protein
VSALMELPLDGLPLEGLSQDGLPLDGLPTNASTVVANRSGEGCVGETQNLSPVPYNKTAEINPDGVARARSVEKAQATSDGVVLPSSLSMVAGVDVLERVLARIDTSDLPESAAGELVARLAKVRSQVDGLNLAALAVADRAKVAGFSGATGTGAWFADLTKTDQRTAVADASLATKLDGGDAPATRKALGEGLVSKEHAAIIVNALEGLPEDFSVEERARAERNLLGKAKRMSPGKLRRDAKRVLEDAGRSKQEADVHQGNLLKVEEDAAFARCRFSLRDNTDGTATGSFTVPTYAADILRKVLQQMTAPRRQQSQPNGNGTAGAGTAAGTEAGNGIAGAAGNGAGSGAGAVSGFGAFGTTGSGASIGAGGVNPTATSGATAASASTGTVAAAGTRPGTSTRSSGAGSLDWGHRQGLAFVELLEHLPTDRLNSKVAATVVVMIDHEHLRDELGAARLDTGHDLSAGQARRLACGAGILPAVLGSASQVLDLGRTSRFYTEAQRTALAVKYDECAAVGCDRPYAWCELHHENPWHSGGLTNLEQAVPLCGYHHRRMHDPAYKVKITTTGGKKTVQYTRRT